MKNFWLMVCSAVLGGVIVLGLLIAGEKFLVERNNAKELVMVNGRLFACRDPLVFRELLNIFLDKSMSDSERVNVSTIFVDNAIRSNRCLVLFSPIFVSRSETPKTRVFPLGERGEKVKVSAVRVHEGANGDLLYAVILQEVDEEEATDFVSFSINILEWRASSSGK